MSRIFLVLLCGLVTAGCDAGAFYIKQVDSSPPEKRPPDWDRTKQLMSRRAPRVGDAAPDFMLASPDGKQAITMSQFHEGRPLVLIFGSFT